MLRHNMDRKVLLIVDNTKVKVHHGKNAWKKLSGMAGWPLGRARAVLYILALSENSTRMCTLTMT